MRDLIRPLVQNGMKKANWKKKIKAACIEVGTYRPEFESSIETLAEILEKRDSALVEFETQWGGSAVFVYPNKSIGMNPALNVWDTLNKSALAYWRDLGLTPAGLKKLNEKAFEQKKGKDLAGMVADLLGEK